MICNDMSDLGTPLQGQEFHGAHRALKSSYIERTCSLISSYFYKRILLLVHDLMLREIIH